MKVAIFTSNNETIILQIKGKGESKDNIDGFDEWFGKDLGRDLTDYSICFQHIGSGEGIQLITNIKVETEEKSIEHWFEAFDEYN